MAIDLKDLRTKLASLQKAKAVAEVEVRQAEEALAQIRQQCSQMGYATPEEAEKALTVQFEQVAQEINKYAALL